MTPSGIEPVTQVKGRKKRKFRIMDGGGWGIMS
jgi:hypothetical protein